MYVNIAHSRAAPKRKIREVARGGAVY